MRVLMLAVILGLTLSPAPVFGCTCAAPPSEVKTASELGAKLDLIVMAPFACTDIDPGKYHLLFVNRIDGSPGFI